MIGLGSLLSELKRRHVYRVAAGYAVGALALVEAAELVLPRLGAPDSVVTWILVVAIVGFPFALLISWTFEITPHGVVRTKAASGDGSSSRPWGALATLLVVGSVGAWLVRGRLADSPALPATERSLAVLPFEDLSPAGDHAWLGDGVAEEILATLTRVPTLRVVARQSSFAMRNASLPEIAEQLGVTHVLTGTVRTEGDRARIVAELIDVASQTGVWSRNFQPQLTSALDAQEQIARAVVEVLEIELGPVSTTSSAGASTDDPGAYENYLRGLALWNRRSEADILSAIDRFQQAVDADPGYAAAWAGLAYAHLVLPEYSPTANVVFAREQSAAAAERALDIDPQQPDALTAMGWVSMIHEYDWEDAERLIAQALEIDPTNVNALHWQSHVLSWQGRADEAIALARRATELDPLSAIMRQNLAFILMEARSYDAALTEADRALASDPDFTPSLQMRWNVRARTGRYDGAATALEEWLIGIGRDPVASRSLAEEYRLALTSFHVDGRPAILSPSLIERVRPGLEVSGQLHASVGDRDTTMEILEQAYRERAGARSLLSVLVNPHYDFLREDPDFLDLLDRLGLRGRND